MSRIFSWILNIFKNYRSLHFPLRGKKLTWRLCNSFLWTQRQYVMTSEVNIFIRAVCKCTFLYFPAFYIFRYSLYFIDYSCVRLSSGIPSRLRCILFCGPCSSMAGELTLVLCNGVCSGLSFIGALRRQHTYVHTDSRICHDWDRLTGLNLLYFHPELKLVNLCLWTLEN